MASCVSTAHRGALSSFIAGMTRLGTTLGPAVGGLVASTSATNVAFWGEALLFTVAVIILRVYLCMATEQLPDTDNTEKNSAPVATPAPAPASPRAGSSMPHWAAIFPKRALMIAPTLFCLTTGRAARELMLPLKATQLGMGVSDVGMLTAVSFAIDVLLVPVAGYRMDHYGRKHAGVPSLLLSAMGFFVMALSTQPLALLASAMLVGFGNGLSNGWIQTVGVDLAPTEARAQFLGIWNLLMGLGQTFGPLALGAISQYTNLDVATVAIGMVLLFGAVWYLVLGDETLPKGNGECCLLHKFREPLLCLCK